MNIFRARHDNVPESPVRRLYGRKGNLLLLPLDVCILQAVPSAAGGEEFRPSPEPARLIAAPIQEEGGGRLGLIAQYEWPPRVGRPVNPVVTVQLAPSANAKGIQDIRVIAAQVYVGDAVFVHAPGEPGGGESVEGVVRELVSWCKYPDLAHRVQAYRVEFSRNVDRKAHGAAVRLETGELVGMLIATQNRSRGACRALVYPA